MPEAMNILLYDDSLQAETLGDACLIAVLASITMLLHLVDMFIPKKLNHTRRGKIYHCIKSRRRTIQSLYREYFFSRAYQMDYDAFMDLHELLKPGINEYICNNNN